MRPDLERLQGLETPCYVYDKDLLLRTLKEVRDSAAGMPVKVHYAVKANGNSEILKTIARNGFGADCVSGREVAAALAAGFAPESICYAGVGKTDREIAEAIRAGIGCLNVESAEELEEIARIAGEDGRVAPVALRVNPDIDAHTHEYITTGLEENKFGIDMQHIDRAVKFALVSPWIELRGLHFHIGSQITIMEPYALLCERINRILDDYRSQGIEFHTINVGGGLGVDYEDPDAHPVAPFREFFDTIRRGLKLTEGQEVHCELGRSLVCQCGSLISRVLYVKHGVSRDFVILDAGMSDLIRPALYQAHHKVENLTAQAEGRRPTHTYDVVGPICESADTFGKDEKLPETHRGDIFAIRSAGAYGESMASTYNMRELPGSIVI